MLENYRLFVAKVDQFCRRVADDFARHISCGPGCAGCCRHLSLFPVEAANLAAALRELPGHMAEQLREQARQSAADGPCPLLVDGLCALYAARPLICRTHGFPVMVTCGEDRQVDYCSLNFQGVGTLPGSSVLDLDRLNAALVSINAMFVTESNWCEPGERTSIAAALLMESDCR